MDYKNELKENNTDLEVIIDLLKSLPDLDIPSSSNVKSIFITSANGCIPEYDHGYATAILNNNIFETSAIGAVVE